MLVVAARNGPIVHDSDATAEETPNRNIDGNVPSVPPRSSLGIFTVSWRPSARAPPRPTMPTPITIVAHGRYCSIRNANGVTISPNAPNTTTNPAVSTADTASARPTAPPRPPGRSSPTNADR